MTCNARVGMFHLIPPIAINFKIPITVSCVRHHPFSASGTLLLNLFSGSYLLFIDRSVASLSPKILSRSFHSCKKPAWKLPVSLPPPIAVSATLRCFCTTSATSGGAFAALQPSTTCMMWLRPECGQADAVREPEELKKPCNHVNERYCRVSFLATWDLPTA